MTSGGPYSVGSYVLGYDSSLAEIIEDVNHGLIIIQDGPLQKEIPLHTAQPAVIGDNVCDQPIRTDGHSDIGCKKRHLSPDDIERLRARANHGSATE